ncbi:MAG: phosphate/phosphite/phosphonate ABC transporter substrate-binding protein [Trueperaceae bacterium]|nr:phosphate/phosphite/phosphonate ABC transporter substrate-binding protein [Trueperaceae bacterium]
MFRRLAPYLVLLTLALSGSLATAQVLAPGYVDTDGDLVADIPTDPAQWIDPAVLIFSYTPVEDPSLYESVWQGFLDHLSAVTGKPVQFFIVESYAAQQLALEAGRLHIAGVNTGNVPYAVARSGFRPFAIMSAADGSYGYEMEIIVPRGSDITAIEQLAGREIAFVTQTSNSGFKAPSALLKSEFGLVEGENFSAVFSGSHENSILGIANGDYQAAAIANSVLVRMLARDVVSQNDFTSIYTSQSFPTTGYGVVNNLHPELQAKIKEAFFTFDWEGTDLQREFGAEGQEQFLEISFAEAWSVVRQIDAELGINYLEGLQ